MKTAKEIYLQSGRIKTEELVLQNFKFLHEDTVSWYNRMDTSGTSL